MKLLVEVVLFGVTASTVLNIPVIASGVGSRVMNVSKIFKQGRMEDYGDNYEYGSYNDYDEDDYGLGDYEGLNGDQESALVRNDGGGVKGRRGGFGVSSQFWGQVFHIHTHHHKVIGVNWDADGDETCAALGTGCSSRQPCCKGGICQQWKCAECSGDYESCATTKRCCRSDQKCVNNKCADWCVPALGRCKDVGLPCCHGAYHCVAQYCKPRSSACAAKKIACNSEYPCCELTYACIDNKCQQCRGPGDRCKKESDCCSAGSRCVRGICKKSKGNWQTVG